MYRWIIFLFAITFALAAQAGPITYQGQLQDSSGPVDTQVDIVFELHEQDEGGSPIAADSHDDVVVTDGLFQVELEFGSGAFDGGPRWLEVIVDGQELTPRQRITATPVAVHALNVPTDNLEDDFWKQGGNAGTDPASDYLGTTDDAPFEIRTGNQRALRLEPADDPDAAPNWIAGHSSNIVETGTVGVTISGGGADEGAHSAEADYVTIGGGASHTATESFATIGGGVGNTASGLLAAVGAGGQNTAAGGLATVAGGQENAAEGPWATVAGGRENTAQLNSSTVGGGQFNAASGFASTVPGGSHNEATGAYSLAAGRRAKAEHYGAYVWADSTDADFASTGPDQFLVRAGGGVSHVVGIGGWRIEPATIPNVIGGWEGNTVGTDVKGATIGGGGCPGLGSLPCNSPRPNQVTSDFGTVGGGQSNTAGGISATIGGGQRNIASGSQSTVPGGRSNQASGDYSFAAGRRAKAVHDGAFVWADSTFADVASTDKDQFLIRAGGGVGINTNSPNAALDIEGNVRVGEELTFFDNSPQRTAGPIAKAFINSDGSIGRAVNIDSVQWDADINSYLISVTGENYVYRESYVSHVTQSGIGSMVPLAVITSSMGGDLLVRFEGGSQRDFQLVIYKLEDGVVSDTSLAGAISPQHSVADQPRQETSAAPDAQVEMARRLERLETENTELRKQIAANSKLAERNANLEDRLAALEALLLEDRQVAKSQK